MSDVEIGCRILNIYLHFCFLPYRKKRMNHKFWNEITQPFPNFEGAPKWILQAQLKKWQKSFDIQRQLQHSTTCPNDRIHTLVKIIIIIMNNKFLATMGLKPITPCHILNKYHFCLSAKADNSINIEVWKVGKCLFYNIFMRLEIVTS